MRCRKCGADSQVLETRAEPDLFQVRRRRKCFNNHLFTTYEGHAGFWGSIGYFKLRKFVEGVKKTVEAYHRDREIYQMHKLKHMSFVEISREVGRNPTTVARTVKRMKDHA